MELRTLQYFLTIAQEESFSKAAKILHVTQPTMSRQIAELEESLGVTLFQRTTRKVVLTDEGLLLRRRAEEILSLTEKTEQELMQRGEDLDGTISIGSGEFEAFSQLADCIKSFSEQHPKVRFNIFTGTADVVKDRLESGLVDIGVLLEPVDTGKFEAIPFPSVVKYEILMRADDPLAALDEIRQSDLAGKIQIVPLRRVDAHKRWMGRYYDEKNFRVTANLPNNPAILVAKGLGCYLTVSGISVFHEGLGLVSKPIHGSRDWKVFLAWKRYQPNPLAVIKFIEYVLRELNMG